MLHKHLYLIKMSCWSCSNHLPPLSRYEIQCYFFALFGTLHRSRHHWRFSVHPKMNCMKKIIPHFSGEKIKSFVVYFCLLHDWNTLEIWELWRYKFKSCLRCLFGWYFFCVGKTKIGKSENRESIVQMLWYAFWLHAKLQHSICCCFADHLWV